MSANKNQYNLKGAVEGADADNEKQDEIVKGNKKHVHISCESAIEGTFLSIYFMHDGKENPWEFMHLNKDEIHSLLEEEIAKRGAVVWYLCMHLKIYKKIIENGEERTIESELYRRTKCRSILQGDLVLNEIELNFQDLLNLISDFEALGSGWIIGGIIKLEINLATYSPISANGFYPLPTALKHNKGLINIEVNDKRCFLWCVIAHIHPARVHRERLYHYRKYQKEINMSEMLYPISIKQIPKFERMNKDIGVNVYAYDKEIFPMKITRERSRKYIVNLLYLQSGDNNHYILIRNLDRFLHHTKAHKGRLFFCSFCMQGFVKQIILDKHMSYCTKFGEQKISLPEKGENILRFTSVNKQLKCPYVIYLDLESVLLPYHVCLPNPLKSSSTNIQKHVVCGYSYLIVGPNELFQPVTYRGDDAIKNLIDKLLKEEAAILDIMQNHEPMKLSEEQVAHFETHNICHICEKQITFKKVRDHDHYSNKEFNYRGPAHSNCNLNYKMTKPIIPVLVHNLKCYDSHPLILGLAKLKKQINIIPINMQKYTTFSVGSLHFKDTYQFLPSSLDSLVQNLTSSDITAFDRLKHTFPENLTPLLLRKGVYPYNAISSFDSFQRNSLPLIEEFYDNLKGRPLGNNDYTHAETVWDNFGIRNLGEFHDLYVTTDTILLACVFEKFRCITLEEHGLDPVMYFSNPGLSWDAMLKMSGVELELFTDIDQHLLVERGVRGGVSYIANRYREANNKYLKSYDSNKPSSYIIYFDLTNLYGFCMNKMLPENQFHFISEDEIRKMDIMNIPDEGMHGYILEVDLDYPELLHDLHNCYPLAPEKTKITKDMISPYLDEMYVKLALKFKSSEKLCCTLNNKRNYIVHYRTLKLYLSLGLILQKIHRVLKFRQSMWMVDFVNYNTVKRKEAKDEFTKMYHKNSVNSTFGKCLQSKRLEVDIKLANSKKSAKKLLSRTSLKRWEIFNEDLVGVELAKTNLVLDKPVCTGMTILDEAKRVMYNIHYNVMKKIFKEIKLLMTDTDSLLYYIEHEDVYKELGKYGDLFDFSNFSKNHPLYNDKNHKKPGTIKVETGDAIISNFVGLRPKVYSIKVSNGTEETEEIKRAKGVPKSVINNVLTHEDYKNTLEKCEVLFTASNTIKSKNHEIFTKNMNKLSLSCLDDKRYLINNVDSYSYGHYKISELSAHPILDKAS